MDSDTLAYFVVLSGRVHECARMKAPDVGRRGNVVSREEGAFFLDHVSDSRDPVNLMFVRAIRIHTSLSIPSGGIIGIECNARVEGATSLQKSMRAFLQ